jgi:flavin-dependent dehydrogenase
MFISPGVLVSLTSRLNANRIDRVGDAAGMLNPFGGQGIQSFG